MNIKLPQRLKANAIKSRKNGFSLIELLAVIVVIGILSAIIVPVVNSVRDSARTTKSLSNLRQLASAMQMYSSDNNGLYPFGYHDPNPGHEIYWYLEIAPYLDQKTTSGSELRNVLVSPFVDKDLTEGYYAGGDVRTSPSTYSVHGVICPPVPTNYTEDPRFPVWNIQEDHSEIILVGEGTLNNWGYAMATFMQPSDWLNLRDLSEAALDAEIDTYSETTTGALSYRANNRALVAFLDCHVEALERGTVVFRNITISP